MLVISSCLTNFKHCIILLTLLSRAKSVLSLSIYFLLLLKIDNSSEEEFMSYLTDERMRDSNFKYLFNELISFKKLILGKNEESKKNFQNLIDNPDVPVEIKIRANKFIEIIN